MPCLSYDTGDFRESFDSQREQLKRDKAQLEAALCTALTFIEKLPIFWNEHPVDLVDKFKRKF